MYLITYTPQAEDDLFEIVLYYTEQGGLNFRSVIFITIIKITK